MPAFFLAIYYPEIGNLAGILGGFATMFVIYIVPNLTYLKMKWDATNGKKVDPYEYEQMRAQVDKDASSPKDGRQSVGNFAAEKEDDPNEFYERIPPTSKGMFVLIVVFSLLITSYGIIAFVFQLTG